MWFGREGRHGVCRVVRSCCDFQAYTTNAYIFMYAFHKQFNHNHAKSYKRVIIIYARRKREEKRQ